MKVSSNGLEKLIPQANIEENGQVSKAALEVFNNWYDIFSTDGKMDKPDCVRFIKGVTQTREEITLEDPRISQLFASYDKNNNGFISRDEFLQFYHDCVTNPSKKKAVWENLRSMGVRNDLKKFSDPYGLYNSDKTALPRYQLAHNEELFNTIFYLQDLNEIIAKEAFNFLCLISTNPSIYKQILFADDKTDWDSLLSETNIYKFIYILQIIESFLEDIEINAANIDSFSNEESILDKTNTLTNEQLTEKKIEWMKIFVQHGGYSKLLVVKYCIKI